MTRTRTALVIGATGGVGGAIADRLVQDGWHVRAINRDPGTAGQRSGRTGLEWVKGDAMVAADVVAAAEGCEIVVHGANPPGYRNWAGLQLPMLASTIAAAKASGARVLFPGTVYNYGADAFPRIDERSAQHPRTRKGAVRVKMEQALREAGVPVLIVRCGDFFGPRPGNNWLSQGIVRAGRPVTSVTYPGPLEVPHAWAYLPDVAETFVRLLAADLGDFEVFQMRGHEVTGHELVAGLEAAAGRCLKVGRLPWPVLALAAPFNETLREMREMRYLWETPVLLDDTRLIARLGAEPRTPLVEALRAALAGQGSLPSPNGEGRRAGGEQGGGVELFPPLMGRDGSPEASRVGESRSSPTSALPPTRPHPDRFAVCPAPLREGGRKLPSHPGSCGAAALDLRVGGELHATHARQDPLRQDLGRPRRRHPGRRGDPLHRPAPHP